jgi:hypothetical protein
MTAWPQKTREFHSNHFDSTVWNDFKFRDGDVIIATYAKAGTTWTQQIIGQLLYNGATDVDVGALSPWLDLRVPPAEVKLAGLEAQTGRRFVKTIFLWMRSCSRPRRNTSTSAATDATCCGAPTTTTPAPTTCGTRR